MINKLHHKKYEIISYIDKNMTLKYIDFILSKEYKLIEVYKNNKNSFTARIKIENDDNIILKVPIGRNNRPWQKLLNIFRNSDAFRIQNSLVKLQSLGLHGLSPILAAQQKNITVKESFFLYRYQEGVEATKDDYKLVATKLLKLHSHGYLRGDCKPSNFLIYQNRVYFIDFRLKKPLLFTKTKLLMEYLYLCKSMPKALEILPAKEKNSLSYKAAKLLLDAKIYLRKTKKKLRSKR